MDIELINTTIQELEQEDTNFNTCEKLAWLYIIRQYHTIDTDIIKRELSDILPHYEAYCSIKRDYQLGKIGSEPVLKAFKSVVRELREFILVLYRNTEMADGRDFMSEMLSDVISEIR